MFSERVTRSYKLSTEAGYTVDFTVWNTSTFDDDQVIWTFFGLGQVTLVGTMLREKTTPALLGPWLLSMALLTLLSLQSVRNLWFLHV